jgi:hypothetical protein
MIMETEEIPETLLNTDRTDRPEKGLVRLFQMKPSNLMWVTLLNCKCVSGCYRRYYYYYH